MPETTTNRSATIRNLQEIAWETAERKGFHANNTGSVRDVTLLRLCLVHTEISEAAQEVKRHWCGAPDDKQKAIFGEELADALIRIFDLAGCVGVDLQNAVLSKMVANEDRPHLYGTPFAKSEVPE